ncbi:MAG: D-alanine--D-alanine ligase [Omnitrophica bacterium]|nr:D-alanine--D-alanine ligase [Candidatus Omnitrophota bacterium]
MTDYGKIAVFAGGPSSEREISLLSGKAVYEALKRKNLDARLVEVKDDFYEKIKQIKCDMAFLALHGKFGEDGTAQEMLEGLDIPYTGSGVLSSRLAMDKVASREVFLENGLKAPSYKVVKRGANAGVLAEEFGLPFVVKPQSGGSSIGLSVVKDLSFAEEALEKASRYGEKIIVERYIHGRELTVGILEESALPVIEIVPKNDVYDFDAKYADHGTEYILPALLDEDARRGVVDAALKAKEILGCRDFSRVDMRMDREGNVYILEVNTIPGLTERSLLPKAAGAAGLGFEDLCIKIIDLVRKREEG